MNMAQLEKQKQVVINIAQLVTESWRRIVVSHEVDDRPETTEQSTMAVYVTGALDDLELRSLDRNGSTSLEDDFFSLNKIMVDASGRTWSSCELIIDASGHYNFSFSYDPPKRINGILDEQSYDRYNNYLDIYKAELAATTVARS